jgi:hypothetical protein
MDTEGVVIPATPRDEVVIPYDYTVVLPDAIHFEAWENDPVVEDIHDSHIDRLYH